MKRIASRALLAGCLAVAMCSEYRPLPSGPGSFLVTVVSPTNLGTREAPLPFPAEDVLITVDVQALDHRGDVLTDFEGEVQLDSRPGYPFLEQQTLTLVNGQATGVNVSLRNAFGPTRIWVEDSEPGQVGPALPETYRDCAPPSHIPWPDPDRTYSYATGVSEAIFFDQPTLTEMQRTDNANCSPLQGYYLATQKGDMIVTGVGPEGFFVTDMAPDAEAEGFNHMYVFNFSYPEGLVMGDRLLELSGIVREFSGGTNFSFPAWLKHPDHPEADPDLLDDLVIVLTAAELAGSHSPDDNPLERYESALVRFEGLQPASCVVSCDLDESEGVEFENDQEIQCRDDCFEDTHAACGDESCMEATAFSVFGQWTAAIPGCESDDPGDCKINVISRNGIPELDPVAITDACRAGLELPPFVPSDLRDDCIEAGGLAGLPLFDVTGNLRHARAARPRWILVSRHPGDVVIR